MHLKEIHSVLPLIAWRTCRFVRRARCVVPGVLLNILDQRTSQDLEYLDELEVHVPSDFRDNLNLDDYDSDDSDYEEQISHITDTAMLKSYKKAIESIRACITNAKTATQT